jgi:neutral trehalase
MQHLVVAGLDRYGYHADAVRIASRFLDTVARNWLDPDPAAAWERGRLRRHRQPGTLYEKYTIDGRVSDDEYAAEEGLGWTAGVYLHAFDLVSGSSSSRDQ